MADIKISNLESTNSLNNFYVPGINENNNNLDSRKFMLSGFENSLESSTNSIQYGIGEFNSNKNYYVGEYVVYNSSVYRFTSNHHDEWDISDVQRVSVFSELESLTSFVYETVYIYVGFNDNLLQAEGTIVTVRLEDGTELQETCDSNGNCSFNIDTGLIYTIYVSDREGYKPIDGITYKSEQSKRYVNIIYQPINIENTRNVEIGIATTNGGSISDINSAGAICYLLNKEHNLSYSRTITNGKAEFENVIDGLQYEVYLTPVNQYRVVDNGTIITVIDNDINVRLTYQLTNTERNCLYLVYSREENEEIRDYEIELNSLFDNNNTWIGYTKFGITDSNAKAIHISVPTLLDVGCDFYFRINDLYNIPPTKQFLSGKASGCSVLIPTDTSETSFFDGKSYTYNLALAAAKDGYYSSAANYAIGETLEINGRILHGFIGSVSQIKYFLKYKEIISKVIGKIYSTTTNTIANNIVGTLWHSSCMRVSSGTPTWYSYYWNGSSWSSGANSITSSSTLRVLPFFSEY